MRLPRFKVVGNTRSNACSIVAPTDFVCLPTHSVDVGELFQNPHFSHYCFDLSSNEVLFVEAESNALLRAPFYYQAQAEQAVTVVRLPLDAFQSLAHCIKSPPYKQVFIHSVGRCGSTLLSKVFGAMDRTDSFSEPDDLTQIVRLLADGDLDPSTAEELVEHSVKWRCRFNAGMSPQFANRAVLKMRSQVMALGSMFARRFPGAAHLFMLRNPLEWFESVIRQLPARTDLLSCVRVDTCSGVKAQVKLSHETLSGVSPRMTPAELYAYAWLASVGQYCNMKAAAFRVHAIWYEELNSNPRAVLENAFQFCGLQTVDWQAVGRVLTMDSKTGQRYTRQGVERERSTSDAIRVCKRILSRYHVALGSDGLPEELLAATKS